MIGRRLLVALWVAVLGSLGAAQLTYPVTATVETIEELHDEKVADPYRWLEDDVRTSPAVAEWVAAQNATTFAYLGSIAERDAVKARLKELWNYERVLMPTKAGKRYAFQRNDGLQNQNVLYVADAIDAAPRVLLDPNTWTKDGTVSLAGMSFSKAGRYLAYAVAEAGSDWRTWRVLDVDTGKVLDDELKWCKFSGAAWSADEKGFFYARFDEPKAGAAYQSLNLGQKIYYHAIGTKQGDDALVYANPLHPEWNAQPVVSEDGRWLVLTVSRDTGRKQKVYVKDLSRTYSLAIEIVGDFVDGYSFVGNDDGVLYFETNNGAPKGRLIALDPLDPTPKSIRTLIPESEDTLTGISLVGGRFVANYLHDAATRVRVFEKDGTHVRDVVLPGIGTASGFGGDPDDPETFFSFSSYCVPPSIYRYDVASGKCTLWRAPKVAFDPALYEVEQVFYTSKDKTRIPMFLARKKGVAKDGRNPTLLYGYGGFNISQTPAFSPNRIAWLERGGILAVANLRGGGEYGEAWHRAGTKLLKQNVFDDFIAAAEWLIAEKWTTTSRLAIQGGSNGGLLVGACMVQRPDLFGACLPAVGVLDMLRFHMFTAGRFWTDDYGSPANAEEFKALRAYSPYHNLRKGTAYPPTLITTADTDDRVVPGHSFKFAAALQAAQAGPAPVLIRIETRAGHGGGKPVSKIIEVAADEISFLIKTLAPR